MPDLRSGAMRSAIESKYFEAIPKDPKKAPRATIRESSMPANWATDQAGSGNPARLLVYPGVYPRLTISLILLGKINAAETDEQNFHSSPGSVTATNYTCGCEPRVLASGCCEDARKMAATSPSAPGLV